MEDEFSSAVRADGNYGAVFEAGDGAAYFYLLDMTSAKGQQIIGSHPVPRRLIGEQKGMVRWSDDGNMAAVFRGGDIKAIFDLSLKPSGRAPRAGDDVRFSEVC